MENSGFLFDFEIFICTLQLLWTISLMVLTLNGNLICSIFHVVSIFQPQTRFSFQSHSCTFIIFTIFPFEITHTLSKVMKTLCQTWHSFPRFPHFSFIEEEISKKKLRHFIDFFLIDYFLLFYSAFRSTRGLTSPQNSSTQWRKREIDFFSKRLRKTEWRENCGAL